jgi:hypothetical protein
VIVGTNDSGRDATGNYTLTLAHAPGTFVVPGGDEGGAVTNGANHPGAIALGDLDMWTFSATAGDSISVSIAESGVNSAMWPWIRLIGPGGALVGSDFSDLVAQIHVTAGTTGTYTLIVGTNDSGRDATGNYVLTSANTPGAFVVSPGDEGGALPQGVGQPGTIALGDMDSWTFTATVGTPISLSIVESGANTPFWPWIRLRSPSGAQVGSNFGDLSAQINVNAPVTGTYTVIVGTNDSGRDAIGDYVVTVN